MNQVSTTLATVQSFVQDCDKALHDIESLVQQLPSALVAAFDQIAATTAFARLRADSANMAAYLQSKGSIISNHAQIQSLSDKIVNDISSVDALQHNMVQYVIQVIPGLSTWVQGYTAYNLLLAGDSRGTNPWDHQVVSAIALPRITSLVDTIKQQRTAANDVASTLPLDARWLYTFDGATFTRTSKPFAPSYASGAIDDGSYYAIWPDGVPLPAFPQFPGFYLPGSYLTPNPGDFCFLAPISGGIRYWRVALAKNEVPANVPAETDAAALAATVYSRLMLSSLKNVTALNQLTEGCRDLKVLLNQTWSRAIAIHGLSSRC